MFLVVSIRKKKSFKIPILTTVESYFTSVKEDTCHVYDPITYTPTALEVFIFNLFNNLKTAFVYFTILFRCFKSVNSYFYDLNNNKLKVEYLYSRHS